MSTKKGYFEATNEAYHAARGRLDAAIDRQLRHIEKTGRPDPEIGKEIGVEKWTVEDLGEQLDREALIGGAVLYERRSMSEREGGSKGGRQPKKRVGIWRAIQDLLVSSPCLNNSQLWNALPANSWEDTLLAVTDSGNYLVYRDGNQAIQENEGNGKILKLCRDRFNRYAGEIRKNQRQ